MDTSSWIVVGFFLTLTFGVGLYFARRAAKSTDEYFLSGRTLPWWLLGTSMVITTFAPDTPLGVAEYSRTGVYNSWFGWHLVVGQILAVFLFARLWRRSGVMTDNELLEIRYSGKSAAGLRIYKACHFALLYNLMALATVIGAMITVLEGVAGIDPEQSRWVLAAVALVYCVLAGFWGVVATDFLQFFVAVGGTVVFAAIVSKETGGVDAVRAVAGSEVLAFWPDAPNERAKVLVFLLVMWWGSYNADGAGYLSQRMLAARDERHASLGTLWFSMAYAGIRMWPWILVGTLSLLVYPTVSKTDEDVIRVNGRTQSTVTGTVLLGGERTEVSELGLEVRRDAGRARVVAAGTEQVVESVPGKEAYPGLMNRYLSGHPVLLGLLVAAFLAAFLSTVDTHLNWGASYLVNDLFRRFLWPHASEKRLVWMAKGTVVLIMVLAVIASLHIDSIRDVWIFTWAVSAGIGPVLILRWFWWRVSAWTEIAALATSVVVALSFEVLNALYRDGGYKFADSVTWLWDGSRLLIWHKALIVVGASVAMAVLVTLMTPPVSRERLAEFVRRVRPPGFWGHVRREVGAAGLPDHSFRQVVVRWFLGVAVVYGFTFTVGGLIYGRSDILGPAVGAMLGGCLGLFWVLRRSRSGSSA